MERIGRYKLGYDKNELNPSCYLKLGNLTIALYDKRFNRLQKAVWSFFLGVEIVDA